MWIESQTLALPLMILLLSGEEQRTIKGRCWEGISGYLMIIHCAVKKRAWIVPYIIIYWQSVSKEFQGCKWGHFDAELYSHVFDLSVERFEHRIKASISDSKKPLRLFLPVHNFQWFNSSFQKRLNANPALMPHIANQGETSHTRIFWIWR